jgi:hypothetical protein
VLSGALIVNKRFERGWQKKHRSLAALNSPPTNRLRCGRVRRREGEIHDSCLLRIRIAPSQRRCEHSSLQLSRSQTEARPLGGRLTSAEFAPKKLPLKLLVAPAECRRALCEYAASSSPLRGASPLRIGSPGLTDRIAALTLLMTSYDIVCFGKTRRDPWRAQNLAARRSLPTFFKKK